MKQKIGIGFIILILLLQLVPKNLPEVTSANPDDLLANNTVPTEIESILRSSCYDCHSNQTNYPWYSYIAPVSFLVSRDTREGREHLNFSNWQSVSKADKAEALYELAEEVEDGEMPMQIYTVIHRQANLSDEQRKAVIEWAEAAAEALYE